MNVIKRDGRVVPFNDEKIVNAVFKAAQSVGGQDKARAAYIARVVKDRLIAIYGENGSPSVEDIQDMVEECLIEHGHARTAKAYILYRDLHNKIRDIRALIDANELIDGYLEKLDWRVNENANMSYSLTGLNNHISTVVNSAYWLNKIYPRHIRDAHNEGDIHAHDLYILGPYCNGWDLSDLLMRGFGGVKGKVYCAPPRHFRTALGQIVNFLYSLQNECAGAVAFSNFDTLLAPFIYYDMLGDDEIRQALQEFLFNMNVSTRTGGQTPFTNVSIDLQVPNHLADQYVIVGGEYKDKQYKDFQKEMDKINYHFATLIAEGDANGSVFTFPIPTYNITKDFDWDNPNLEPIWAMTARYGTPYFANYVNSNMDPSDTRSMCCRLKLSTSQLHYRGGGLFGAAPLTGSIGVVTLNMPRIGYTANNWEEVTDRTLELMDIAKESLEIKRSVVEKLCDQGLYPYSKYYLDGVKQKTGQYFCNHFSTIGLNGMNECLVNYCGEDIGSDLGRKLTIALLDAMNDRLLEYQEETGHLYNLEATPAEGTSYRFALLDRARYPNIIQAGTADDPYYTNSTQLPVNYTDNPFDYFDLQDEIQTKYTGGTVAHLFLGEKLPSTDITKVLVRIVAEKYKLPYFTITPTFSVCPNHGYMAGEVWQCPKCGADCDVFSRVVGYIRPVRQWNKGKKSEYNDRKVFRVDRDSSKDTGIV